MAVVAVVCCQQKAASPKNIQKLLHRKTHCPRQNYRVHLYSVVWNIITKYGEVLNVLRLCFNQSTQY